MITSEHLKILIAESLRKKHFPNTEPPKDFLSWKEQVTKAEQLELCLQSRPNK